MAPPGGIGLVFHSGGWGVFSQSLLSSSIVDAMVRPEPVVSDRGDLFFSRDVDPLLFLEPFLSSLVEIIGLFLIFYFISNSCRHYCVDRVV